jgi:hypothetical protein
MPSDPLDHPGRGTRPEQELQRRSGTPAISPWLIVGLFLMLGAVVYAVSALL